MATTDDLRKLLDAVLVNSVTEIESENYRFTTTSGPRPRLKVHFHGSELVNIRVTQDDEEIIEKALEKLTTYKSLEDEYFGYGFSFTEVNDWIPVEDYEEVESLKQLSRNKLLYAWKTPIDDHYIYVYRDNVDKIKAKHPIKYNRSGTICSSSSERMVLLKTLQFLQSTDPYEVAQKKRKQEVAEEKFTEITGVGKRTCRSLIKDDILSFEGLLDNIGDIKRDYQQQAKKEVQERIENGDGIETSEYIQEIPAQVLAENV